MVLVMAIQTRRIAAIELVTMRIIVATYALSRDGCKSLYPCVRVSRMACLALHGSVGAIQRIHLGMLRQIKTGGCEMGLIMAVQTRCVTALELTAMRIFVTALTLARDGDELLDTRVRGCRMTLFALHGGMRFHQRKRPGMFGHAVLRWRKVILLVTIETACIPRAELTTMGVTVATFTAIRLPDIA